MQVQVQWYAFGAESDLARHNRLGGGFSITQRAGVAVLVMASSHNSASRLSYQSASQDGQPQYVESRAIDYQTVVVSPRTALRSRVSKGSWRRVITSTATHDVSRRQKTASALVLLVTTTAECGTDQAGGRGYYASLLPSIELRVAYL